MGGWKLLVKQVTRFWLWSNHTVSVLDSWSYKVFLRFWWNVHGRLGIPCRTGDLYLPGIEPSWLRSGLAIFKSYTSNLMVCLWEVGNNSRNKWLVFAWDRTKAHSDHLLHPLKARMVWGKPVSKSLGTLAEVCDSEHFLKCRNAFSYDMVQVTPLLVTFMAITIMTD